jgi:hypothetical protein
MGTPHRGRVRGEAPGGPSRALSRSRAGRRCGVGKGLPIVCCSSQAQAGCVNQRSAARPIPQAEPLTQAPPRCRDRGSRVQPGTCRRPAGGPPRLVANSAKPYSGLDPKRTVGGSSRCLSLRGSLGGLSLVMDTVGMVERDHAGGVAPSPATDSALLRSRPPPGRRLPPASGRGHQWIRARGTAHRRHAPAREAPRQRSARTRRAAGRPHPDQPAGTSGRVIMLPTSPPTRPFSGAIFRSIRASGAQGSPTVPIPLRSPGHGSAGSGEPRPELSWGTPAVRSTNLRI